MSEKSSILTILQNADSFFPGGATSISSGLEGLVQDQIIQTQQDVEAFISGQLQSRWALFDRVVVNASASKATDLNALISIDRIVEAQTLSKSARAGSKRTGNALLGVHVRLQTPFTNEYQKIIHDDAAHGHSSVVQGMVWRNSGVNRSEIESMSAHCFVVGLTGAALRLGIIGHIGAQGIISRCRKLVESLSNVPPGAIDTLTSFTPQQEIAMMRHESAANRLFIN